jgi:hypothetical protein
MAPRAPRSRPKPWLIFLLAAAAVVVGVAGVAGVLYTLGIPAHTDLPSAEAHARRLVASVGGPVKVCDEGNQVIKHFGKYVEPWHERDLDSAELKDYPAIAALVQQGRFQIATFRPDRPSTISIRFGTHSDMFCIEVADRDDPWKVPKSSFMAELQDGCVFVHR